MLRLTFSLPAEISFSVADNGGLKKHAAEILGLDEREIIILSPAKRSLDARKGRPFLYVWTVELTLKDRKSEQVAAKCCANAEYLEKERLYAFPVTDRIFTKQPVVAGFGPAGIFCALMLARAGARPVVLERGGCVEERVRTVTRFFTEGILDTNSNIQFGEGGAGTFSDGKLNTLVKDKTYRGHFVLREFVKAGAPEDILYINKPHIGTDRLREAVVNMRDEIITLGGTVLFNSRLTDILSENGAVSGVIFENNGTQGTIETDTLFLGTGRSAREIFSLLDAKGIDMERKPFAVGVRIEHPQSLIDKAQYREYAGSSFLPPADYKLVYHTHNGRALYTFCMCPGGMVVAGSSESGGVVTNGMSYRARDMENANSALLVAVMPQDLPDDGLFAGVKLQRSLEEAAFTAGGGGFKAPCQCVGDFLENKASSGFGRVKPSYPLGVTPCNLNTLLPGFVAQTLREGLLGMDRLLKGFALPDAVLTAPESRSTSPIRIRRGEDMQSNSLKGLYPIGEGAGWAGGIMSAAIDGIKAAESYCHLAKLI